MMATAAQKPSELPQKPGLALHWRVLITLALLVHLTAVIAAPMSVPFEREALPSEIPRVVWSTLSPYIFPTYLNHGYRFFAPAPSPGHLVRYTLEMPDGDTRTGVFPDLKTQWPRLFYHRHFMLSEKLTQVFDPEQPSADAPPQVRAEWEQERQVFNAIVESYARYLLKTSGAKRVTLQFVQHNLPSPADLENDRPLDDPQLYVVLWTGSYGSESL